jgi:hypothetical protein
MPFKPLQYYRIDASTCVVTEAIIKVLLYYDIFHYPLKEDEILRFLKLDKNEVDIKPVLADLLAKQLIFQHGDFYSFDEDTVNIERRLQGNKMAELYMPLARAKASLIGRFPFVRSVMASGSLSKGYMDKDSDLDFFIVTSPGRLWITRMMLVLYKRIFLLNSHRYFCINYFISTDRLEIEEKNQFTATELATVIPLYGDEWYTKLLASNEWLKDFYPNFQKRSEGTSKLNDKHWKSVVESILNRLGGDKLDAWCMRITQKRWNKIYATSYENEDFKIAFKSKRYVSKNHPRHYQKKIVTLLEERWAAFEQKFNVDTV